MPREAGAAELLGEAWLRRQVVRLWIFKPWDVPQDVVGWMEVSVAVPKVCERERRLCEEGDLWI